MKQTLIRVAVGGSALALVLVACGVGAEAPDSADTEVPTSSPSETVGGTTAEPTDADATNASATPQCDGESVSFQLSFFPNAQAVGYLIADARGFYEDAGLDLEVVPGGPTVNPPLQLAQGNVDIAQLDFAQAANAAASGSPIDWVALTYQQSPLRYIALEGTELSEPADLEGTRVGTQQAGDLEPELAGMLAMEGLTVEEDIDLVSIGFAIEDLLNESVEVFPLRTFFHIAQLETAGIAYPDDVSELNPNDYDVEVASQGIAVNTEFADGNPGVTECFLAASERGWQSVIEDPESATEELQELLPEGIATLEENETNVAEVIEIVTVDDDGNTVDELLSFEMEKLEESLQRLEEFGVVEGDVGLDSLVDSEPIESLYGDG